jgi:hypothetical protein
LHEFGNATIVPRPWGDNPGSLAADWHIIAGIQGKKRV